MQQFKNVLPSLSSIPPAQVLKDLSRTHPFSLWVKGLDCHKDNFVLEIMGECVAFFTTPKEAENYFKTHYQNSDYYPKKMSGQVLNCKTQETICLKTTT
jgi:hypothetical protein